MFAVPCSRFGGALTVRFVLERVDPVGLPLRLPGLDLGCGAVGVVDAGGDMNPAVCSAVVVRSIVPRPGRRSRDWGMNQVLILRPQRQPLALRTSAVPSPVLVPSIRVPSAWVWVIMSAFMMCSLSSDNLFFCLPAKRNR